MTEQIVSALQQGLRGRVIGRGDTDYEDVRALYNGIFGKKPSVIARCVDVPRCGQPGPADRDPPWRARRPGAWQLRRRPDD